jgi:hypothetical protein
MFRITIADLGRKLRMQMLNYLLHSWRERKMQILHFSMISLWMIMGN